MKERPIIFNAEMVRAILDGRKTQTRRMLTDKTLHLLDIAAQVGECHPLDQCDERSLPYYQEFCPFGLPGDRLWVRETSGLSVRRDAMGGSGEFRVYRASNPGAVYCTTADGGSIPIKWIPSIHMPRKACRILLEITDVRVELLQSISFDDCRKEGCSGGHDSIPGYMYSATPREHYSHLWESIYGEESWRSNPWVWVIEFKRVEVGQHEQC